MAREKQKIKSSNLYVSSFIKQSENVSVLEKVSKPAQGSFFLLIFFFVCLFLPTSFIFSLYLETEKREGEPPAGLEEAALRAPSWRNLPPSISSVEEST